MTKEEAIEILEDGAWWDMVDILLPCDSATSAALHDAIDMAIDALRTQPVKLDRSRWEGCSWCWAEEWIEKPEYCPICGRPLTGEAWAELERRIGGNDGTTD